MKERKIDWDSIHRHLESVGNAMEKGFSPGPDEKKRILKSRSEALSREEVEIDPGGFVDVLEFVLASESYAIESRYIREVHPIKDYTPLPGTPPFVLGLINIRGEIISVIDIRKFFDLPERGISDLNKVIVIHDRDMEFGILADNIITVRNVALNEIQASLPTLSGIRQEYLKGVTARGLVVLDAGKLLKDEKIIVHQEI